jgi:hypothetical protein
LLPTAALENSNVLPKVTSVIALDKPVFIGWRGPADVTSAGFSMPLNELLKSSDSELKAELQLIETEMGLSAILLVDLPIIQLNPAKEN